MKTHRSQNTVHSTLSVVLATRNEEANIGACLESVSSLFADLPAGRQGDIVVVDEYSTDKTREIAKVHGARVFKTKHNPIFHITKQAALDKAKGDWILQLDADERVTPALAKEIKEVINMTNPPSLKLRGASQKKIKLFDRHQRVVEAKDGKLGTNSAKTVAYFIPRQNFFLGEPLTHAGVYPDGVIRLLRKGKTKFPAKSVHEQIRIDGKVGWLANDLEHHDSPTLARYIARLNRYTDLHAQEIADKNTPKNLLYLALYSIHHPLFTFLRLYLRHRGYRDGMRGLLWSAFSAWHFPLAYYKYWTGGHKTS